MAIRVQRHANVSKQATLLDGLDVSQLKKPVCGCGFNRFVHEGINTSQIIGSFKDSQWKCKYNTIYPNILHLPGYYQRTDLHMESLHSIQSPCHSLTLMVAQMCFWILLSAFYICGIYDIFKCTFQTSFMFQLLLPYAFSSLQRPNLNWSPHL